MTSNFPAGWELRKVRDLVRHVASGPSPLCEERNVKDAKEWGLLKTNAITWDGWNPRAHKVLPESYWGNSRTEVHRGDVLVTKAGPRNRVGVVSFVDQVQPRLNVSGKMVLLRANEKEILPRVLAGALSSFSAQQYLTSRAAGMAESQVNFSNDDLLRTEIPVPPMCEQRKIVDLLDCVDRQFVTGGKVLAKTAAAVQGFESGLLSWHPGAEVANGWGLLALEEVAAAPICYGIIQAGAHVDDGVPIVMIRDLNGDFRGLHEVSPDLHFQYSRSQVRGGDVLLSIKATIGRAAVAPSGFEGNISRDIARIRVSEAHDPNFLQWLISTPVVQKLLKDTVVGTTRAELSIASLKKLSLPMPETREQLRIVEEVESGRAAIKAMEREQGKVMVVKEQLARDLFSGKVRVNAMA
ncbi:restriction endonuclease subunit S [Streptomyces sp. NPDC056637]|uniref:restriction endonuclease subunit S n=1 Tax=unclassified Streptomyces TaxID=2593676 RepID=UPI003699924D